MCVFTYGQTNSGKTHSMKGTHSDPGLVHQTLEGLFSKLGTQMKCCFEIQMSYFEIYNEGVFDLLNPERLTALEVRENKNRQTYVHGLTEMQVSTLTQAKELYDRGEAKRKYAETNLNHNSSRSHVIVQLRIKTRFIACPAKTYSSILMMADLAGSECVAKAGTTGHKQREGAVINKSLLALSNIIMKLSIQHTIPSFRDSKLTRILQPVLSDNSVTMVICTVNPSRGHLQEGLSTLRFGTCAGGIKMKMKQSIIDRQTPVKKEVNVEYDGAVMIELELSRQECKILKEELVEMEGCLRQEKNLTEILQKKVEFYERAFEDQRVENEQIRGSVKEMERMMENQEYTLRSKLETDHTKALWQIRADYEGRISSLKAELVEIMENGNGQKLETKVRKRMVDLSQKQEEMERELVLSRSIIYKLKQENRNIRKDLELINEAHTYRARKIPVSSPSVYKSGVKSLSRIDESVENSPRSYLYKFPIFKKGLNLSAPRHEDPSRERRPNLGSHFQGLSPPRQPSQTPMVNERRQLDNQH